MGRNSVTDTDKGYADLMKRFAGFLETPPSITVGIHDAEADEMHEAEEGEESSLTVGEIATFHEFGLGVPERSFIRGWADEQQDWITKLIKAVLVTALKGQITKVQGLEQIGQRCVGAIQQRIADKGNGAYDGLKEETIKRKGSDVPLINTGQLRSSITYQVHEDES